MLLIVPGLGRISRDDNKRETSPGAAEARRNAWCPAGPPADIPGQPEEFDLYYVRAGRKSAHPLVIIPGGPGVASLQVYRLRRRAANAGLDVIMIEHRGIGMSRHDDSGADLPPEAITVDQVVDDVAAVLDDARVRSAVIYGTSYGSYIAAGVGVRHPGRVHAMILDSPLLSRHDIVIVRDAVRGLFFDGDTPETAALATKPASSSTPDCCPGRRGDRHYHLRLRWGVAAGSRTGLVAERSKSVVVGPVAHVCGRQPQRGLPPRGRPGQPHRVP